MSNNKETRQYIESGSSVPIIGFLCSTLTSPLHRGLLLGIVDEAKTHNLSVIAFTGGPLNHPNNFLKMRNVLYDLIDVEQLSGLIIPASSLGQHISIEQFLEFQNRFASLPVVNIGSPMTNAPTITSNYYQGLTSLLSHLIEFHGKRRIAFIRGAEHHQSSIQRLAIFNEILKKYDIVADPNLIVQAEFTKRGGMKAVSILIDKLKADFDTVITMNEITAVGVIQGLQERGIRVPEQVGVVGFEGGNEGIYVEPPLTTIRESAYEQGRYAVGLLLNKMRRQPIPKVTLFPAELEIRESCGCKAEPKPVFNENINIDPSTDTEQLLQARPIILAELNKATEKFSGQKLLLTKERRETLLDALWEDFKGGKSGRFGKVVKEISNQSSGEDMIHWYGLLQVLRRSFLAHLVTQHNLIRFEQLWETALQGIENQVQLAFFDQINQIEKLVQLFRQIGYHLINTFYLPQLAEMMSESLNMNHCYIVLYEGKKIPAEWSRLIMAYRNNCYLDLGKDGIRFKTARMLPPNMLPAGERFSFIIQPLYFREEHLGYIIFSQEVRILSVYEALQAQISSALKNDLQLQELREAEERFSDIAHTSSDWLWETDAVGRFTYCSEGVSKVLGYTATEMIGRTLFDFLRPGEEEYLALVKNRLLPNRLPICNVENWNLHKDGHLVGLLISGIPILKGDGTLIGYRGLFKDITEQKQAEAKIKYLAYNDPLTGLSNRSMFTERINQILAQTDSAKKKMALMFLDLDRFKNINDTLGHFAGDELLQQVAERLKSCVREHDLLARLGGDEFIIFLPELRNVDDVTNVAKRILRTMDSPFKIKSHQFYVTTSIGIAIYPTDGKDLQNLLKNADKAMYRAKEHGRNSFTFFDKELEVKNFRLLQLEKVLYDAVKNERFQLYYQPQVNCKSGEVVALEALLRLNHTELGKLSPMEFVPVAEEIGLIDSIGSWVMSTACRQGSQWNREILPVKLAVNLSARQFRNNHLADEFISIIEGNGIKPEQIELEITENTVIEAKDLALKTLLRFKDAGMQIALDDFGTGYSSLSMLKRYPFDIVKIDKSFIADLADPDSAAIVKAIIVLARSLKLTVVAEGVENQEQLEYLRYLGCDRIQGYLFSQPLPVEELTKWLEKNRKLEF